MMVNVIANRMRVILSVMACALALIFSVNASAKSDASKVEPIEVVVKLGNESYPFLFDPNLLEFETGKSYRLVLLNEGPHRHFFVSEGLAKSVSSQKLEVFNREGKKLVELKGQIAEIDTHGYTKVHWSFVPTRKGRFDDLICNVPGHADHGMKGTIVIK
jgi:uncharacterized cupredoxin-like copper-binding protein